MSPRILWSLLLSCLVVLGLALVSDPRHWAYAAPLAIASAASPALAPAYTTQQTTTVATILTSPTKPVYDVGEILTVTIQLQNLQGFFGGGLEWSFDPRAVRVLDAEPGREGVQVTPGPLFQPGSFIAYPREGHGDNVNGKINFAGTYINGMSAYSGDGNLVLLNFQVVGECGDITFPLTPETLKLSDMSGSPLPFTSAGSFQLRTYCPVSKIFLPLLMKRYNPDQP